MSMLDWALYYRSKGLAVMPVCSTKQPCSLPHEHGKVPLLPEWKLYQETMPTEVEIKAFWTRWPDANIAIICGKVSGNLVAIDIDNKDGKMERWEPWIAERGFDPTSKALFPDTWFYRTGGGGLHLNYRTSWPLHREKFPWGEFQAEGSYIVTVPSLHFNGNRYGDRTPDGQPIMTDIGQLPDEVAKAFQIKREPTPRRMENSDSILEAIDAPTGEREEVMISTIGRLCGAGLTSSEVETIAQMINSCKTEPFSDHEMASMILKAPQRFAENKLQKVIEAVRQADSAPKEETKFPIFPERVITGFLKTYVDTISPIRMAPKQYHFFAMMQQIITATSGTICLHNAQGKKIDFSQKLYLMFLGLSGLATKSTAFEEANKIVKRTMNGKNYLTRFNAGGSGEGLGKLLMLHRALIIYFDEFRILLSKIKQEGNTLLPLVTALFEGNEYQDLTVKGGGAEYSVHLELATNLTIEDMANALPSAFRDIGFMNRLFFVYGEKGSINPDKPELTEKETAKIIRPLIKLLAKYGNDRNSPTIQMATQHNENIPVTTIKRTAEAQRIYEVWYRGRFQEMLEKNGECAIRLDRYIWTFEIALTISTMTDSVTPEIMKNAITLAEYGYEVRKWAFAQIQETRVNKTVEKITKTVQKYPGRFTPAQLRNFLKMGAEEFFKGLDMSYKASCVELLDISGAKKLIPCQEVEG